jgi:hypothetical protein
VSELYHNEPGMVDRLFGGAVGCPSCGHWFYRPWKAWQVRLMNLVDFRYWFCECEYVVPYGLVVMAECWRHDDE